MNKILIVDDMPANIKVLVEALKNPVFEIFVATNGETALNIANSEAVDLILLDVMMPDMDGYEVCKKLKSNDQTAKVPVIFVTSLGEEEDETRGLELGAVDYITKPIRTPIVKARVKNHLELKKQRDILENLSSIDGLTGIANRRRFDRFLDLEWRRATRTKTLLSLIMMDIDYFKKYNDNYGHFAGDDCLKKVADVLQNTIKRKTDLVARYGGEEFACVLPLVNQPDAISIAKRILKNITALTIPHAYSDIADHITMSLGAATVVPSIKTTHEELIETADQALYEAKAAGRNQVKSRFIH
jgi:diguanylate cyclase (GGDEF)-like protein